MSSRLSENAGPPPGHTTDVFIQTIDDGDYTFWVAFFLACKFEVCLSVEVFKGGLPFYNMLLYNLRNTFKRIYKTNVEVKKAVKDLQHILESGPISKGERNN